MEKDRGISRRNLLWRAGVLTVAGTGVLGSLYGVSEMSTASTSPEDAAVLRQYGVADLAPLTPEQAKSKKDRGTEITLGSLGLIFVAMLASLREESPQQY